MGNREEGKAKRMSEDINNFGTLVPKRFAESLVTENARLKEEIERLNADKKHTHLFPPVIESNSIPDGQAVLVNIYQHRNDADEIKRLKAEVEAYKKHYEFMKGQAMERFSEICRQDEKIERLLDAGNMIVEGYNSGSIDGFNIGLQMWEEAVKESR